MPRIDDQPVESKRAFKKKAYRPWNLMDDDLAPATKSEHPKEKPASTTTLTTKIETLVEVDQVDSQVTEPITVQTESSSDMVIKRESYGDRMVTEQEPISNHIDTDVMPSVTIQEPVGNRFSNPISNQISAPTQTNRPDFYVGLTINDLITRVSGLQRKILFYIVEDCILNGSLSSSPITNEVLQQLTNANRDTVKTAMQRLFNKKLLSRGFGKPGRGGFAIYCITEEIRNSVIDAQKRANTNHGMVTNWVTKRESISPFSSGSNINTTTKEIITKNMPDTFNPWDNMDIEPLSNIGFTKAHLKQIIMDDKLPCDIVQDSIFAFSFDLDNNNKQKSLKTSPLNYFMGILRSGTPYAPPANYESPQDKAMRMYLERKKEINSKRQAMEDELFQIAFNEWEGKLTNEEKESLLPPQVRNSKIQAEKTAFIRIYFKEQIWPSVKFNCNGTV